ncbi:MAG: PilZ domain-containing protein [Treponema sp.]|jgi:hypothetical protein|nr:PilZ domain-containing protein [Treponema sp.]
MAFFKKKKEEENKDEAVQRAPRYDSVAGVRINGFDGQALLKNISLGGFCMQSKTFAALVSGEKYIMKISPEKPSGLGAFDVEVEVRWVRSEVSRFEAGLLIAGSPSVREMEKYIAYLASRPRG